MTNKWVSFFIADERYCCSVSRIREILPYTEANPFPGADKNTEGILSIRGKVLTILDGFEIFRPKNNYKKNNIIIVEDESANQLGITVERVDQIIEFDSEQIEPTENQSEQLILGTVNTQGQLVIVVDFTNLIAEQQGLVKTN